MRATFSYAKEPMNFSSMEQQVRSDRDRRFQVCCAVVSGGIWANSFSISKGIVSFTDTSSDCAGKDGE